MSLPAFLPGRILLAAGLFLSLGCGGGGGGSAPPPVPAITGFTAAASPIGAGSSTTLLAQFTGGNGSIDPDIGAATSGVAVSTGPLTATTTFTLTVTGGGQSVTRATTVTVLPAVAVTVAAAATGLRLENGFAGFSYEKSKLNSALFTASDTGLVALFGRLGSGVLRVGGNSVDQTTWTPAGPGLTSGQIAPADVDRLAGFLKAANWQVIYGLNFATNQAAGMAAEAAYAARVLGDRLYGFELGNEPDLYHSNGLRPATYSFAQFLAEWRGYAAAIQAQVPAAVFTGPASAYNTSGYTAPFAQAEGQGISLLTQHYYRANGQLASSTVELLLSPDPALPATLQALQSAAKGLSRGYRLAEANSFYNGGAANVSDAYGTALWAVDFLFSNALYGSAGVNFHGGGSGPGYTPIADSGTTVVAVRPEFYGMELVARMGPGNLLGTSVAAGGLAISAYAVAADGGGTRLLLVNREAAQGAVVTIHLGAPAATASLTVLTGAGLDSPTGTLLNGAAIGIDGTWTAPSLPAVPVAGSTLTLAVAPASAVLAVCR